MRPQDLWQCGRRWNRAIGPERGGKSHAIDHQSTHTDRRPASSSVSVLAWTASAEAALKYDATTDDAPDTPLGPIDGRRKGRSRIEARANEAKAARMTGPSASEVGKIDQTKPNLAVGSRDGSQRRIRRTKPSATMATSCRQRAGKTTKRSQIWQSQARVRHLGDWVAGKQRGNLAHEDSEPRPAFARLTAWNRPTYDVAPFRSVEAIPRGPR